MIDMTDGPKPVGKDEWLMATALIGAGAAIIALSLAGALLAALPLIRNETQRRARLAQLIAALRDGLRLRKWRLDPSQTPIQPLIVGSNEDALGASEQLRVHGILVPAIRPPTVPPGTARLRISLSAAHTLEDVQRLVDALHAAEAAA